MTSHADLQNTAIHILHNISQIKGDKNETWSVNRI